MHVADLLNHLAGAGKHRGRHVEAERTPWGCERLTCRCRLGRIGDALLHMACLGRATELFVRGILLARRLSLLNAGRLRVLLALRHEAFEIPATVLARADEVIE